MAAYSGQVVLYNRTVELLTEYSDVYKFGTSDIRVSLHSSDYVPNTNQSFDSDLSGEVASGNYVRKLLQGREVLFDEATGRFQFVAARVTWPRATFAARWAVVRFASVGNYPNLVCWVDLGQTISPVNALFEVVWINNLMFEIQGVPDG